MPPPFTILIYMSELWVNPCNPVTRCQLPFGASQFSGSFKHYSGKRGYSGKAHGMVIKYTVVLQYPLGRLYQKSAIFRGNACISEYFNMGFDGGLRGGVVLDTWYPIRGVFLGFRRVGQRGG
jgi:hypothetical protein